MKKPILSLGLIALAIAMAGCSRPQPVVMAPPVQPPMPVQGAVAQGSAGVFNWQDVPQGQQVPITRAVFDQGGYQLYAASGETIVIPFANQNMYVMKFGQSPNGQMFFVNEGAAPTLYVPNGGSLENAAAQGARWYPFSQGYHYTNPVYIGLAPTWSDFVGMGWYPGMSYYGGYWGYNPWRPGLFYSPMVGLNFYIGGHRYSNWDTYRNYYRYNTTGRIGWSSRPSYSYNTVGRRSSSTFSTGSSFGSSRGTTGSFGRSSGGSFGRSSGSTGSFGTSRNNFGTATNRPSGSFGSSGGSFGSTRPSGGAFGSGSTVGGGSFGNSRPSGSFGGSQSGFGSTTRSRGSFGSGSSGFSGSSGGSFGRSSGGSSFGRSSGGGGFGSFGRSSSGGFGGGGRSSFGGGRRGR